MRRGFALLLAFLLGVLLGWFVPYFTSAPEEVR